jgi:hypothetical protein
MPSVGVMDDDDMSSSAARGPEMGTDSRSPGRTSPSVALVGLSMSAAVVSPVFRSLGVSTSPLMR